MWNEKKTVAIILAAGNGKRMQTAKKKQYMELLDKPLLYYSLKAFDSCALIDEIVLVTAKDETAYCRNEIVKRYGIKKVTILTEGGAQRYHSVYEGLKKISACDYVLIHDGARPFVTESIIRRTLEGAGTCRACAAGMPSKDTIRMVDDHGMTVETPERKYVWCVQTPQTFEFELLLSAFGSYFRQGEQPPVTDDVMLVEAMTGIKALMTEGDYSNIKITTPEDMELAKVFAALLEQS